MLQSLLDNGVLLGLAGVISAACGGAGTLMGVAGGFLLKAWLGTRHQSLQAELARARVDAEINVGKDQQALAIFQKVVESLMPRIAALEAEVKDLSQKESECRAQNAALVAEVKALRADNEALRAELSELKGDLLIARA